jgi:hypothetical protein
MDKIKEAQAKYRPPNQIKVLFVGESPPSNGKYFILAAIPCCTKCGSLLEKIKAQIRAF